MNAPFAIFRVHPWLNISSFQVSSFHFCPCALCVFLRQNQFVSNPFVYFESFAVKNFAFLASWRLCVKNLAFQFFRMSAFQHFRF